MKINRFGMYEEEIKDNALDAVKVGKSLVKEYLYRNKNKTGEFNRYADFNVDLKETYSYDEKNKVFSALMHEVGCKVANIETKYPINKAMNYQGYRQARFEVIGEVLDGLTTRTDFEQYFEFADVKRVGYGDSATFHIASKGLFNVSKVGNGKRHVSVQRMYLDDITLNPTSRKVTTGISEYMMMADDIDWGMQIARTLQSIMASLSIEVATVLYGAEAGLAAAFKENAYSQDAFIQLAERVAAANGVMNANVYGTKTALGKVIPTTSEFGFQRGDEYLRQGYVASPFGVPVTVLAQTVKPNTNYDFVVPNNKLVFLGTGDDKPVKIAIEGETKIITADPSQTSNSEYIYTLEMKWDVAFATQQNIGIMTIA